MSKRMSMRGWVGCSAAAAALVFAVPASADVTSVSGSAFGVQTTGLVTFPATPLVTLPASGSGGVPITASVASVSVPGVVDTKAITVSTNGTTGPTGSATSFATVADLKLQLPGTDLTADAVSSTCTSNSAGSTGSTTLTNAKIGGLNAAVSPAPNTVLVNEPGVLIVLNEQTTSGGAGTSSITVTAIHVTLLAGTPSQQDIYIAQSHCDVSSPTAVQLQSFAARQAPGSVVLRWSTASELQTVGFNVYRQVGSKLVKLNAKPIAARGSAGGAAYSLVDRKAPRSGLARYRLQAIQLSGARAWLARASLAR